MRVTRMILALAVLTAIASVLPATAQGAAICTFEARVAIDPGVTPTPTPGTFTTIEPGTIECTGALEGSGPITFEGVTGSLAGGESCALDVGGAGSLAFSAGADQVTGTFTFSRLAVAGGFEATTSVGPLAGVFEFEPAEGQDCVNTPITEAKVTGQAVVVVP